MQVEVRYRPSYSLAMVSLEPDEQIQVEAGAMVGMSPTLLIPRIPKQTTYVSSGS